VEAVAKRRADIETWLRPNPLDALFGRIAPRVETQHFALVVDVSELPEGRKKVGPHALAHRIAADVEHVAERVAEHYRIEPSDYRAKMRMWLWRTLADHQKAMQRFLGTTTTGDFKLLGRDPVFSVWTEPGNFDDVYKVRSVFAHNSAHMLTSNAIEEVWVGDEGGGWLDAGLGHWYEYEIFGRTSNYCIEEATAPSNWEKGVWRAPIRRRLERERDPFLPGLLPKHTGAMSQAESAISWSFYDFLVARHSDVLRAMLADLKKKQRSPRAILEEHLGQDLFEIERAWRAWVAETYPIKGDEPRAPGAGGKKR